MRPTPDNPATQPHPRLDPPPGAWASLAAARFASVTESARDARRDLGLATDRPIIMSGHQPGFWHGGIIAKVFALLASARAARAQPVWLIVDHDTGDFGSVDLPTMPPAQPLRAAPARILSVPERTPWVFGRPEPPLAPAWTSPPPGCDPISLAGALDALAAHAGAASIADQATLAMLDLLGAGGQVTLVRSSALSRTRAFATFIRPMMDDPARTRREYNAAAARHADANIAPLADHELPLWSMDPARKVREKADDRSMPSDVALLAPRALTMTAFLRSNACDLFIHGTGGTAYEQVNDDWFAAWSPGTPLAPFALATADLRLPIAGADITATDLATSRWLAHSARHNPRLVGDARRDARKRAILAAPHETPRAGYRALHELLDDHRRDNAAALGDLDRRAASLALAYASRDTALRRDWAWFLLPHFLAETLRARTEAAFAPAGA